MGKIADAAVSPVQPKLWNGALNFTLRNVPVMGRKENALIAKCTKIRGKGWQTEAAGESKIPSPCP
jgi:hypothetical protein